MSEQPVDPSSAAVIHRRIALLIHRRIALPIPRRIALRLGALWAATAAAGSLGALSGCGGGDSPVAVIPGGGGTGTVPPSPSPSPSAGPAPAPNPAASSAVSGSSFGVITSTAPLTVCATTWQVAASTTMQLDDPELEGLQLGMMVRINGSVDPAANTGIALDIASRPVLRGAVEAVNSSGFTVAGVGVVVDVATVFAGMGGLSEIKVGDMIQVHGHLRPNTSTLAASQVRATRIRRVTRQPELARASGVARLGTSAANGFAINSASYSAAPTAFVNTFANALAQPLREGSLVHVVFDTRPAAPVRIVTQITPHLQSLPEQASVRMQGQVEAASDGALRINDIPVNFPGSTVADQRALAGQLVQITASLKASVLSVTEVRAI